MDGHKWNLPYNLGGEYYDDLLLQQAAQTADTKVTAQNENTVTVTVSQVPSSQPFGHATISVGGDTPVGLVPNSNADARDALVVEASFDVPIAVPGKVEENTKKPEASATFQVTPDQAKHMTGYIQNAESGKQSYDPGYRNCATFVEEVLRAGGVKAPNDITPGNLVRDLQKQYPQ